MIKHKSDSNFYWIQD